MHFKDHFRIPVIVNSSTSNVITTVIADANIIILIEVINYLIYLIWLTILFHQLTFRKFNLNLDINIIIRGEMTVLSYVGISNLFILLIIVNI